MRSESLTSLLLIETGRFSVISGSLNCVKPTFCGCSSNIKIFCIKFKIWLIIYISILGIIQNNVFLPSFIKTIFITKSISPCARISLYEKKGNNLNSGFYKDLDTNFNQAYEMSQKKFSHEELLEMLKNGNIPEKQIAAMSLDYIDEKEACVLIGNLTGCDGKIREAAAFKINQFLAQDKKYIDIFAPFGSVFADGSVDINGNICRIVIDCVKVLKENKNFSDTYIKFLINIIDETFKELDKIVFRDKKYTVNKQLFKLYWCLESLKYFAKEIPESKLYEILEKTSKEKEYTIREKTAEILVNLENEQLCKLGNILKNDENYYVRAVFEKPHQNNN